MDPKPRVQVFSFPFLFQRLEAFYGYIHLVAFSIQILEYFFKSIIIQTVFARRNKSDVFRIGIDGE